MPPGRIEEHRYSLEQLEHAFVGPLQAKHEYLIRLVLQGDLDRAQEVSRTIMRDLQLREEIRIQYPTRGPMTMKEVMDLHNRSKYIRRLYSPKGNLF
jgi:hypothetical protein